MAVKIDLHTHSEASHDGSISPEQYAELLKNEVVDIIAITDHDRIDFAKGMQKALGSNRVIVGQEVTTVEGDIIGLYLTTVVPAGLSALEAAEAIHAQKGLVCIPHPFETVRKGISTNVLESIKDHVDIIEGCNGRAFLQNYGTKAIEWAKKNNIQYIASSDAHGVKGVGKTYTIIRSNPKNPRELMTQLKQARLVCKKPPIRTLLYPFFNRIKHLLGGY